MRNVRQSCSRNRGFFLTVLLCSYADSLSVTVSARRSTAARGHSVVLGCEFSPDLGQTPQLSGLVVTWQRQEDNRVVHSYYFERDQLDKQDSAYHNRTSLFVGELRKGNASLKIASVEVNDAGHYLCTVSTNLGTDKAELRLDYGALYTEPRLTIKVGSSEVLVQYETEGYPEPELKWTGEQLGNRVHTSAQLNAEEGLYYVQSSYTGPNTPLSLTFSLENQLLRQSMQRPINYSGDQNSCFKEVIALSVLSVLLVLTTVTFTGLLYYLKTKRLK